MNRPQPSLPALPHPPRPQRRRGLVAEVARALDADRLALALQPVVDARAPHRAGFHEGLLRLLHADGSVIAAGAFVPLVEAAPLGRALDRRALDLALDALRAAPGLRLSVNVSPLTIGDALWEWVLEGAFDADPTVTERLIVEITEAAVAPDPGAVAAFAHRVRATGASVALDDFGAGAPSFRHLRAVPFDILKIDGAFASGVDRDPDNRACIAAMVGLGHHFEALVVAEGVETAAEARALTDTGVDALQGYLFGHPRLAAPGAARCSA